MKNIIKLSIMGAALVACTLPVFAQNAGSAPVNGQSINNRKDNQQDRIANGVADGQLTAGETRNLEGKEAAINGEERDMRKLDNGKLTAADKATINQQQNQLSRQIYKDKHNAATLNTDPKSEVGQRGRNQQDRIAQGLKSGQLTAGEASHLENREGNINKEIATDRAANGGKLTNAERAQVNRQQNQVSKQIYKDKHNNKRQ